MGYEVVSRGHDEFEATLREQLNSLPPETELKATDRLADLGLDSLNSVHLLLGLEEKFCITFPDEYLSADVFQTVESLWVAVRDLSDATRREDREDVPVGD